MPIPGAINLDISVSFLGDIGSIPHTHVHTYYHGTIDTSTNAVDGVNINSTWYLTFDRDKVGYNYSRFYPTLPRPAAGINQFISGAGGTGSRVSVDPSQQLWSNAGFDQRSVVPSVVTVGDSVDIPYYFADRYSLQIITFYTDNDTNPYNGEQAQIGYTTQPPQSDGTIGTNLFHWHPTAADIGTHYIRVKAVNSSGYTRYDYLFQPITVRAAQPLVPAIISVTPATLTASASAQPITISGYNFNPPSDPNASMLVFYDPQNNPTSSRTPTFVYYSQLNYNATFPSAGTWHVKVVNGGVESSLFPIVVTPIGVQLTSLSISGPATVNENNTGQFTATAIFSDGTTQTVTAASTWSDNSSAATISTSGLLSASNVGANTPVTVMASYTVGSITKTASFNTTIVNTSGGGGTQTQELIVNGDFSQGTTGWQAAFSFYADNRFSNYHSAGGYAYLSNPDGSAGNNLYGEMAQTVTIPANATQATLSYWYRITTAETEALAYDAMSVKVLPDGGSVQTIDWLSNTDANGAYQQRSLDLTRFRGQRILLDFVGQTDVSNPTTFRIDDVSLQVVVTNPLPPVLLIITASAGSGGTISPIGNLAKSAGANQTFTAYPNANYLVNQWLVDGSVVQSGGTSYTFYNIQSSHNIQVSFNYTPFTYTIDSGSITITHYFGSGGVLTIPSTITGKPVTSIGDYAFSGTSLTSVNIPNSVIIIGQCAFYGCTGLNNVIMGNQVANIGNQAFSNTGITSIVIPNSVTNIGFDAFDSCWSLTNATLVNGITCIQDYTFNGSGLTSITIPNTVTNIGIGAFSGTSLTSVTIPNSVTKIGSWAFGFCTNLTQVAIPDSVTTIGDFAFYDCLNLTNITLVNGITSIQDSAFSESGLTSITIPNSVTNIGVMAFNYCTSLIAINVDTNNPAFSSMAGVLFNNNLTTIRFERRLGLELGHDDHFPVRAENADKKTIHAAMNSLLLTGGRDQKAICGSLVRRRNHHLSPATIRFILNCIRAMSRDQTKFSSGHQNTKAFFKNRTSALKKSCVNRFVSKVFFSLSVVVACKTDPAPRNKRALNKP